MTETNENRALIWFTPGRFGALLAVFIFAAYPQVVLGLQSFVVRDFGFFVYPLAEFQKNCFWHGQLPFWDPYNNCGVPFLAQWNTMPLYPPALIYLLLPLQWSLSFFSLFHLWFAGMGMFFLARRWTGNHFAAAFAGTVFAFNGFALNLLMWPSHMATYGWMPWVIFAIEPAWRVGGRKILLAALVGAMQMLAGGPEIIFMTWLIAAAVWILQFVRNESPRTAMLWRFPSVVILVIALTAIQLLPFLDLVSHAQRSAGFADMRGSMPGHGLANFLVPMAFGTTVTEGVFFQHGQSWTSSYYLGLGTLWLALLALFVRPGSTASRPKIYLLFAIVLTGLIFALGENTPVLPLLRKLIPQLSFITYPVKYFCVTIFAAPLLAAFALADFARIQNLQKRLLLIGGSLSVALVAVLFWTQLAPLPGDDTQKALWNGISRVVFLILTAVALLVLARVTLSNYLKSFGLLALLLLTLAWLDVFTHEPAQNPTAPSWIFKHNISRQKLALEPQPELGGSRAMISPMAAYRFVSLALTNPVNNFLAKRQGYCGNCNLFDDVPKVDGFFSLTPKENNELLSIFYTSTNASHPPLENFLGVSQLTAPDEIVRWQARTDFLPLITAGQKPLFEDDPQAIPLLADDNFDGSKMVYLPKATQSGLTITNGATARVLDHHFGLDTVDATVEAEAPSLVVIAQTYYHNWRAELDGQPAPLLRADVAFQAVQIPAGRHQIHLFYRDSAFETGAWISGFAWIGCLLSLAIRPRRS